MSRGERRNRRRGRTGTAALLLLTGLCATVRGEPAAGQAAADSVVAEAGDTAAAAAGDSLAEGVDYRIFDRRGNPISLAALVASAARDEVLLVGEEHDDMVAHRLQQMILDGVVEELRADVPARKVVLSLEMFERDVQYILDEYLAGLISEEHFLQSSRPWDHYEARYRPLVEAAKEGGIPVVAANAPRRYVNRVTSEGPGSLEDLSHEARRFLPPLPYPGPSDVYRAQWDSVMAAAMEEAGGEQGRKYSVNPNAIHSQALWDAAMAHSVTRALVRSLDGFVVHVSGSFHVAKGTGIPERIADYRPGTTITTLVLTKVDDVAAWSAEDHGPLADFVILTRRAEREASGH